MRREAQDAIAQPRRAEDFLARTARQGLERLLVVLQRHDDETPVPGVRIEIGQEQALWRRTIGALPAPVEDLQVVAEFDATDLLAGRSVQDDGVRPDRRFSA